MTRAQARTRDIYAANVEKSRATRDPITFQLHDASGALKKGGVAVEEAGWDRPAPGAATATTGRSRCPNVRAS